jgi:hypothetical protein
VTLPQTGWLSSYLWQVALHGSILGLIFYIWAHRIGLPAGRVKRRILAVVLVLPMLTAAVPGRTGLDFAERLAWFNSGRVLAIPIGWGLQLYYVLLAAAAMTAALTIWQEVVPTLRRPRSAAGDVPDWLLRFVATLPGWEGCTIGVNPQLTTMVATAGMPSRPRLIVSRGALQDLSQDELCAVLAHEHAHWREGRWIESHVLFVVRLLQCYHPAALWAFREYCVELEIECDAAAANRDALVRALLRTYKETSPRDVAARAALRRRVDVLMSGARQASAPPGATLAAAASTMTLVLPWIV